ncbi:putative rhodopsin kinase [Rosellinia necatrix]|uniref:non-specific serine/threonine protein kinase n=1 Tax=Rosellinia necatrix TaxID=77044 RepID=A0A1S7UIX6_ROSNE|nr:putative rhodopsin kinase [Rosellinia necatrix]
MMDPEQAVTIQAHPLGTHLNAVCAVLNETVQDPAELETVSRTGTCSHNPPQTAAVLVLTGICLVLQDLGLVLLPSLRKHVVSHLLTSPMAHGNLSDDISTLISAIASDAIHSDRIKHLLRAVLAHRPDVEIWEQVYCAVTESTPGRAISSILRTPWRRTASNVVNSSERRHQMDKMFSDKLGVMHIDVPNFYEAFFGGIPELEMASENIFRECTQGTHPLFRQGWAGWPENAERDDGVFSWLADLVDHFLQLAQPYKSTRRRPLAQPNTLAESPVAKRKLDVGFVDDPKADRAAKYHWSRILVPGELRSNLDDDTASKAHFAVARSVKKVFTAQPTRRFVLAFTLCGSWMRLWEFDRLGGIASEKFDINKNGQRFVSTILGFLWMSDEALGFDPTIIQSDQQYIEIRQDTKTERLVLDRLIRPAHDIVGRATICWKAYLEGDRSRPFVIKDSWQFPERDEEGKLLQEATRRGVTNVARHYYHETVRVQAKEDDIQGNVRRGLDITRASNYRTSRIHGTQNLATEAISYGSSAGSKRLSSQADAFLPPSKRPRLGSASPTGPSSETPPNRIHRRIVLCDYGKPIYKASSRGTLLSALEACVQGHESLFRAGFLHRDISINNLMINESDESLSSFLIDLDFAVKVDQIEALGADKIIGTRAFIAIGVLMNEGHSFMDDLESFFWVLFWTCVHYNRRGESRETIFTKWNEVDTLALVDFKKALIDDDRDFIHRVNEHFTPYYKPLIPWVDKLRKVIFPNNRRWQQVDDTLYSRIRDILRAGQNDPLVVAVAD